MCISSGIPPESGCPSITKLNRKNIPLVYSKSSRKVSAFVWVFSIVWQQQHLMDISAQIHHVVPEQCNSRECHIYTTTQHATFYQLLNTFAQRSMRIWRICLKKKHLEHNVTKALRIIVSNIHTLTILTTFNRSYKMINNWVVLRKIMVSFMSLAYSFMG